MQKLFPLKPAVFIAFVLISAVFASAMYGMYEKTNDTTAENTISIYTHVVEISYGMFNDELSGFDSTMGRISTRDDFADLCSVSVRGDTSTDGALQFFSAFSPMVQSNEYITDTCILFKNNNMQITNKKLIMPDDEEQFLSIDGVRGDELKQKIFTSFKPNALFYGDRVYLNGKTVSALIYCSSVDSPTLSGAKAVGAAIIPISKINEALKISSVFKSNAVLSIYCNTGYVYNSGRLGSDLSDYTIIDCDDNEYFSLSVYVKNSFFSKNGAMASSFVIYAAVIVFFAFALSAFERLRRRRLYAQTDPTVRRLKENMHISSLFTARADEDEIQWFRENLPDFPRPCVIALFKGEGMDSPLVETTFENSEVKPLCVYPYPSGGYVVAFFPYRPDGKCMEEIKKTLSDFVSVASSAGVSPVISISTPCMDIDEIYDASMAAAMMFKYNECDSIITVGDAAADGEFSATDRDNDKMLGYLISGNSFEADKIIYGQWYELTLHPSFGDEIEKLFISQIDVLASAAVKTEYEKELPRYDSSLSVTELAFVVTAAADSIAANVIDSQNNSSLYGDVISYIDDNFTNSDFSQTDVKEKFDISSKLISKILRQKKNMLFSEYLESLRIEKARYILTHSDIKIYDISKMCGYGTNDAFYKAFNKKEGMTPGAYRKANGMSREKGGNQPSDADEQNCSESEEQ